MWEYGRSDRQNPGEVALRNIGTYLITASAGGHSHATIRTTCKENEIVSVRDVMQLAGPFPQDINPDDAEIVYVQLA